MITQRLINFREGINFVKSLTFRSCDRLLHHTELSDGVEAAENDPDLRAESDRHDRAILEAEPVHGLVRVVEGIIGRSKQTRKTAHQWKNIWTCKQILKLQHS